MDFSFKVKILLLPYHFNSSMELLFYEKEGFVNEIKEENGISYSDPLSLPKTIKLLFK